MFIAFFLLLFFSFFFCHTLHQNSTLPSRSRNSSELPWKVICFPFQTRLARPQAALRKFAFGANKAERCTGASEMTTTTSEQKNNNNSKQLQVDIVAFKLRSICFTAAVVIITLYSFRSVFGLCFPPTKYRWNAAQESEKGGRLVEEAVLTQNKPRPRCSGCHHLMNRC